MQTCKSECSRLGFALILVSAMNIAVAGQSTIAAVPSTDVVAANSIYLEFDFTSHFAHQRAGGFQSYTPRVVVGLGHRTEIGVNVSYTNGFGAPQPIEIQPNIKWQFYQNESAGVAAGVGAILYTPVTHRGGT